MNEDGRLLHCTAAGCLVVWLSEDRRRKMRKAATIRTRGDEELTAHQNKVNISWRYIVIDKKLSCKGGRRLPADQKTPIGSSSSCSSELFLPLRSFLRREKCDFFRWLSKKKKKKTKNVLTRVGSFPSPVQDENLYIFIVSFWSKNSSRICIHHTIQRASTSSITTIWSSPWRCQQVLHVFNSYFIYSPPPVIVSTRDWRLIQFSQSRLSQEAGRQAARRAAKAPQQGFTRIDQIIKSNGCSLGCHYKEITQGWQIWGV